MHYYDVMFLKICLYIELFDFRTKPPYQNNRNITYQHFSSIILNGQHRVKFFFLFLSKDGAKRFEFLRLNTEFPYHCGDVTDDGSALARANKNEMFAPSRVLNSNTYHERFIFGAHEIIVVCAS